MVKTTYVKNNKLRYMAAVTFSGRGHYTEGYVVKRICYAALKDIGYPEEMLKMLYKALFIDADWSGDRLIDGPSERRDEAGGRTNSQQIPIYHPPFYKLFYMRLKISLSS